MRDMLASDDRETKPLLLLLTGLNLKSKAFVRGYDQNNLVWETEIK